VSNQNETCFECEKEIEPLQEYRIVALDKPYKNLFFHKKCLTEVLDKVGEWDNLVLYIPTKLKI
jgi:hypothetical protein